MNLRLRVPPPVWLLLFGGLMWLVSRLAPVAVLIRPPADRLGWIIAVIGVAIIVTAMLQFHRARTTINPLRPARASLLVSSGVFGYSRNPMYLGLSIVLAGWAVVLGALSPWAVLPIFVIVIDRLQIRPEELVLADLFGAEYHDYCTRVGRWFGRRS